MVIRDSRLVVSCAEIEHFEYAVALLGDPIQTLVNELSQLKLAPNDWEVRVFSIKLVWAAGSKCLVEDGSLF